jgi:hypothetical protein
MTNMIFPTGVKGLGFRVLGTGFEEHPDRVWFLASPFQIPHPKRVQNGRYHIGYINPRCQHRQRGYPCQNQSKPRFRCL